MRPKRHVSLDRTTMILVALFVVLTVAAITPQQPVRAKDRPLAGLAMRSAALCESSGGGNAHQDCPDVSQTVID